MSRPQETPAAVRVSRQEFEERILVRAPYTEPQPSDFVTVVETVILRDCPGQKETPGSLPAGRSLLLKLHNGTDTSVRAVTFAVEQLDRTGRTLDRSEHSVVGYAAAGTDFVPDWLMQTDKSCTAVRVEMLTADTYDCRYVRADGQTILTYPEPAPVIRAPLRARTAVYAKTDRLRPGAWTAVAAVLLPVLFTGITVWGSAAGAFLWEKVLLPVLSLLGL